jgi:hypothetical protein
MSTDSESFATRLHHVLDLDEVEARDRVPRLARAARVSKSAARRWLAGQCLPTDPYRLLRLSKALVVDMGWLCLGRETTRTGGVARPEGPGGPAAGAGHGGQERRLSGGPRGSRGDSGHPAVRRGRDRPGRVLGGRVTPMQTPRSGGAFSW